MSEHETEHVERLIAEGKTVVEIAMPGNTVAELAAAEAETLAAMRAGADVIYQATFFDGRWRGHADFLLKVERPSPHLGAWSYEVADTKLARRVKAAALLQMCAYSEQVERLQGVAPERMYVITGDAEVHPFTLTDYSAYYRTLKARFVALIDGPTVSTYPDPVDHCGICRWGDECKDRRRADDHLSLVSGMRRDQTRKLTDAGIATRHDLAAAPVGVTVSGMADASVERLRHQAELQVRGEGIHPPIYELLPPEPPDPAGSDPEGPTGAWPKRGWSALPEPSPGDLYFDMEGDPFAIDGGLEYLFGVIEVVPAPAANRSTARSGRTTSSRRRRLRRLRRLRDEAPGRAPRAARLPLRALRADRDEEAHGHGTTPASTRSTSWLRGEVFVDLYAAVRPGCASALESYSLKQVETSTWPAPRARSWTRPTASSPTRTTSTTAARQRLDAIERYNEDDCRSTLELHRWLEARAVRRRGAVRSDPAAGAGERHRVGGGHRARGGGRRARRAADRRRARGARRARRRAAGRAGCSRRCSTGTAARPSPTGGCTSPASTMSDDELLRRPRVRSAASSSSATSAAVKQSWSSATRSRRRTTSSRSGDKPYEPLTGEPRRRGHGASTTSPAGST